ncbi:hypothetical protein Taro_049583 [Colocasia esculenta]|uniref:Uncharacterized protein n=1 Tax=Colocasia esculenta TaxID=4460 RepID=A0A843XB52_COLES|nr:hypothetical protein [Colocasia esculenta]
MSEGVQEDDIDLDATQVPGQTPCTTNTRALLTKNLGYSTREAFRNRRRTTTLGNTQTTTLTRLLQTTIHDNL